MVPRVAVVQMLCATTPGDLITVVAPPGYGKTTAVSQWDDADPTGRQFAWLRLDHLDNDPTHLLLHIATAVDRVIPVEPAVLRYLRGPGRDPLVDLVPAMLEALAAVEPIVLVIDDVHELSVPLAVAALDSLVESVPAATTIALVGRGVPTAELARRRVHGDVLELGVAELALSEVEARAAFRAASGRCDAEIATAVVDRCEGWAAGITLAALALCNGATVDSFTGRHELIADYLVAEVLNGLDGASTTFLEESAVLDRFTAGQLNAVLGRQDSAGQLARLWRAGSGFLVCLDGERIWYRHHRLFGDLLRERLRTRDPARFRELAIGAAEVLERDGDIDGALRLAVAAEDRARAAALVGRDAVRLGFDGRAGVLARRLALLDHRTFVECPDAAIARAWLGVTTANANLIQSSLLMAGRSDRGRALADGTPSVKVAAALVSSLVGVGGVTDVVRHSDTVRAAGDYLVNPWWGAASVMNGAAEAMIGNVSRARCLLESALPVTVDLPGFQAAALAHLALLDLDAGDDVGALQHSTAARSLTDAYDLSDVVPMVVVYAVSAVMAARAGDEPGARDALVHAEKLLDRLGYLAARTALLGHGLLAWTAALLRDTELLTTHLALAERARRREPDAVALGQRVDRVRSIGVGSARPLTAAELRLLPYLATHLSLQRAAEELMIGRETAKSQATSIYRKLAVSSRATAVAEARRIGLLPS